MGDHFLWRGGRLRRWPCFAVALTGLIGCAVAQDKAKVYYAMDSESIGRAHAAQASVVRRMVDSLVCGVSGKRSVAEAWKTLVSPEDVVGIKVSAAGRSVSGTHPEVVEAIAGGLVAAGVSPENIIVWDRNLDDLIASGFRRDGRWYRLEGVDPATGYDPRSKVSAPVLGKLIWGDSKFGDRKGQRLSDLLADGDQLSSQSYYAKVLAGKVTRVINVPSLTDSFLTGIQGGIVNMTLPNLDNWRRFAKSASQGDPYLAEIFAEPLIREKVVLTILDALVLQYAGGPFPNSDFVIDHHTLFASIDPVAIDATALRLIEEARKASKLPSVKPMAAYIEAGSQLGLGQAAESRIEMLRVGIEELR